jgi:hypothetical protein
MCEVQRCICLVKKQEDIYFLAVKKHLYIAWRLGEEEVPKKGKIFVDLRVASSAAPMNGL